MLKHDEAKRLEDIVGPQWLRTDPGMLDTYAFYMNPEVLNQDGARWLPRPAAVVMPETTAEVQALVKLAERLQHHEELTEVPGLILPDRGVLRPVEPIRNLDEFSLPRPEQLSVPPTWKGQQIWVPLQTRRGCAMNCSYCSTPAIEGKLLRRRSPDLVVKAMARFVDAGFTHFYFVDNTFNLPPAYAKELCDHLVAGNLDIRWRCILYPWKVE